MAKVVYLSPSQHGDGANKCLLRNCWEDKHTRPIAEACAKYLEASGFKVVVAKKGTDMTTRCRESDKAGADLHVPIHTNASGTASARYLMFMCIKTTGEYKKIFNAVAPRLEAIYPDKKKAQFVVRTNLYEINVPKAKTFYCELGFHTNKTDVNDFIHESDKVGKALAHGICDYYGVDFKGEIAKKETKPSAKVKFIKEVQEALGAEVDGIAGAETLSKTVTISATKNRCHKVVKPLQEYLEHLGYDCGEEEGLASKKFIKAVEKYQFDHGLVSDGEITAKAATWKKLLGLK